MFQEGTFPKQSGSHTQRGRLEEKKGWLGEKGRDEEVKITKILHISG